MEEVENMPFEEAMRALQTTEALTAINTAARNVLLAKLAYSQGAVSNEVVEGSKRIFRAIAKNVVDSCEAQAKKQIQTIVNELMEAIEK